MCEKESLFGRESMRERQRKGTRERVRVKQDFFGRGGDNVERERASRSMKERERVRYIQYVPLFVLCM